MLEVSEKCFRALLCSVSNDFLFESFSVYVSVFSQTLTVCLPVVYVLVVVMNSSHVTGHKDNHFHFICLAATWAETFLIMSVFLG